MRALVCDRFGPPETLVLGELPTPLPGKGEVLIDVAAAGVSFADTLMIRDLHQNKHSLPFAPGMEVAGRIAAVGDDVQGFQVGERVMALVYDGGHAEHADHRAHPRSQSTRRHDSAKDSPAHAHAHGESTHDKRR